MKRFDLSDWPELAGRLRRPYQAAYHALYSSLYDGIVTDPVLMLLPLDDHMVHRGDGVFEAVKLPRSTRTQPVALIHFAPPSISP